MGSMGKGESWGLYYSYVSVSSLFYISEFNDQVLSVSDSPKRAESSINAIWTVALITFVMYGLLSVSSGSTASQVISQCSSYEFYVSWRWYRCFYELKEQNTSSPDLVRTVITVSPKYHPNVV